MIWRWIRLSPAIALYMTIASLIALYDLVVLGPGPAWIYLHGEACHVKGWCRDED